MAFVVSNGESKICHVAFVFIFFCTFAKGKYIHVYTCTVLSTKRVEWVVFQSFDIFSVIIHAIETKRIPT